MTADIVYVLWEDAGHMQDWNSGSNVADWAENDALFTVETVGQLIGEHERWILVAPSVTVEATAVHSPMRIMRASILIMETIDGKQTEFDQANRGSIGDGGQEGATKGD